MYDGWRYYHTVLQRVRWDKPMYLGSLGIVHTAPTYAVEQAAIIVQGVWRKRQGWKMLMAAMASVWSKTVDPTNTHNTVALFKPRNSLKANTQK